MVTYPAMLGYKSGRPVCSDSGRYDAASEHSCLSSPLKRNGRSSTGNPRSAAEQSPLRVTFAEENNQYVNYTTSTTPNHRPQVAKTCDIIFADDDDDDEEEDEEITIYDYSDAEIS